MLMVVKFTKSAIEQNTAKNSLKMRFEVYM
jgi:hypothetical protein